MREQLKERTKQFDKSENDLKALQSVGQIVGEVLKQLTEDKCKFPDGRDLRRILDRFLFFQSSLKLPMALGMLWDAGGSWTRQN